MNNKTRIILMVIGLGILTGLISVWYVFNMPERNIQKEKPAYTITAPELIDEFIEDEDRATTKYFDQLVQVEGKIVDYSRSENSVFSIFLENEMQGLSCTFDSLYTVENLSLFADIKIGDTIKIKGRCDGMLMDVKLSKCVIICSYAGEN